MHTAAGVIALVISISANIPYILESIQGKVKPERVSWFIWTLLGVVYFSSAIIEEGAVLFTAGELVGPVVAFILALKFGVGGKSKFDIIMLILALMAIALLIITKDSLLSLILALIADGIAMTLTIRKLHVDPSSESRNAWAIFVLASFFALLSLETYTFETMVFPLYVMIGSSYIALKAHPSTKHKEKALKKL